MPFALDHIVIAVADLDDAVVNYRSFGFTVHPGGLHHGGLSQNALIVFADGSYVELIAFREDAPANRWWQILKGAGERMSISRSCPTISTQTLPRSARAASLWMAPSQAVV